MRTERLHPAETTGRSTISELALVGEIAALMDSAHPFESVEAALRRLREHSRAEACELFLTASRGREVVLVSHQGEDLEAFCQQERFRIGEGFPGIALRDARSLLTEALGPEVEFARSRVKSIHYRQAICVPVRCREEVVGCVLLAWKVPHPDLDGAVRLIALATRPIGTAVQLVRARARMLGLECLSSGCGGVQELGERFRALTAVDAVTAVLGGDDARETLATRSPAPPIAGCRRGPSTGPIVADCPARRTGRVQVSGGRTGWAAPCVAAGCTGKARYCIPLSTANEESWGVVTVAFRDRAPVPLTRHLPVAVWLTDHLNSRALEHGDERGIEPVSAIRARLRILCLGGFEVSVDGRTLECRDFGRAKARELLGLLVAASGRPVSGEWLMERLWPGSEPDAARNRFHVTLSALRSAVEPVNADRWVHVRRDGRHYYLDPDSSVSVDLWRFRDLLRRAEALNAAPSDRAAESSLLERAVELYEGEAFGAAFTGRWCDGVARQSKEAALDALDRLAELKERWGVLDDAVAALRRAEEIGPLRQDLRRRLMRLLTSLGRPNEAVACYDRLKRELAATLGLEPAPDTQRLHEAIREQL